MRIVRRRESGIGLCTVRGLSGKVQKKEARKNAGKVREKKNIPCAKYSTPKEAKQTEKFIENPMVCDSLWNDLDELERQIIEEEEAERADLEFECERERALFYMWSKQEDGYIF